MDIQTLISQVKLFLRDNPKANELTKLQETTDEEYFLFAQMALSDWNSTPPLIQPVKFENHPCWDWLILATSVFALQSAGVLNYRNELPYNDSGISVNRWSKGPQYFNTAGMWAQMIEVKKREIKVALNYAQTFGMVLSSEFTAWNFASYYQGTQLTAGLSLSASSPVVDQVEKSNKPTTPGKTPPLSFGISDWVPDPINQRYSLFFHHNLYAEVDVRIIDPQTKKDLKGQCDIVFANQNLIQMFVPMNPDGRFAAEAIAYKI